MGVHRSTDCGHTWTGPFEVTSATNPNGGFDASGGPVDAADKEFIDVDPDTGRVVMSWSNFTPAAAGGVEISTTYSDNITATPPTWSPRRIVAATDVDGQGSIPRFAGRGSRNAYVAWSRFPGGLTNNIGFARSTDNGATWSAPVSITQRLLHDGPGARQRSRAQLPVDGRRQVAQPVPRQHLHRVRRKQQSRRRRYRGSAKYGRRASPSRRRSCSTAGPVTIARSGSRR